MQPSSPAFPPPLAPPHSRGRRPIGVRGLLVALVCAVLVPLALGTTLRIRERAQAARAEAERRALDVSRVVAGRLDERARNVQTLLAAIAHQVRPDAAGMATNDALLLAIRRDLPHAPVTNLWVMDSSGANVGTSFRPLPDRGRIGARDRRYFRDVMRTGRPAVGDPVRSRPDSTQWSVTFAHPVLGGDGVVRAMVLGTVHLEGLGATLRAAPLPAGSSVTVVDARGVVLAHRPGGADVIGRDAAGAGLLPRSAHAAGALLDFTGGDGERRLMASTATGATGWRVVVGVPRRVAYAEVRREVTRDVLFAVATLTLALGLSAAVAARVVAPIDALAADAKALAAGDYARRSRTDVPREVATLARAFNDMAATIDARTAALHRSEQRYRQLFDACPLPLFVADVETHRVLAANDAACAAYGYTRAELLALTLLDLRPPEDRLRFLGVSRALAKAQKPNERTHAGVWRHRHRDGTIVDVEVFVVLTEFEGRRARMAVVLDVTARRRAERALLDSQDQLRRAQKMEALGRFAGGIAHDFNNLLTGILGYCDLALGDDALPAETRGDFSAIREAAQRAAGLTGRILAFSRGRVGQPVALDLNDVVAGLEPMLARMIGEHIRLVTELAPSIGSVLADPAQAEQVVMNLVLNARDAMPGGGALTVSTRAATVEPDDPAHAGVPHGRWTVLEVRDTGIGMDAETQAHIFEPFFTTKDRSRGTGLGLATVYGIVTQGGGAVRVWSEPGTGSRFTIYLPRVDAPAEERRAIAPSAPRAVGGAETVLLVEDEDAVRVIARESLVRRGYRVLAAPDAAAAIAIARRHAGEIDLLLTDVVMPGLHGRELAELLAREQPSLRVLFMSGYTEDEVLLRGVSADEVALLTKPFTPEDLAAHVRAALDEARGVVRAGEAVLTRRG